MNLRRAVSKKVRLLRTRAGISQQKLAKRIGLSVRYITRLENSEQNITLNVLEKLGKGLGVPVNEIVLVGKQLNIPKTAKNELEQAICILQGVRKWF